MIDSFQYGLSQLSLLAFTTLSPSAACAFVIVGVTVVLSKRSEGERIRLSRFLIIPTAISLVGLIASTSHLGKPSNSLFVLTGIGRSPLSNEVAAAVVFAGMAWMFCMMSFTRNAAKTPFWAFLGVTCAAAVAHVWFTGCAYEIVTIITWYTPFTVLNQFLQAIAGGCLLAILTYVSAGWRKDKRRFLVLLGVALVAAVASLNIQLALVGQMDSLASALVTAAEYVPYYPMLVGASFALCVLAIAVEAVSVLKQPLPGLPCAACSTAIMLAGIAVARFGFYCAHLTAGI